MSQEHLEQLLVKCPECSHYFIPAFDGDDTCDKCQVIENIEDFEGSDIIEPSKD
jgi:uncharacterized OB-fold protein